MIIGGKQAVAPLGPVSQQQQSVSGMAVLGEAFGAVAKSLQSQGLSQHEIQMALMERERNQKRALADVGLTDLMGVQDRALMTASQQMKPGGDGFANGIASGLTPSFEEFAKKIGIENDPQLMNEYRSRWETFAQDHTTKAYALQMDESNRYLTQQITTATDKAATAVHNNPEQFKTQYTLLTEAIDKSDLPSATKDKLKADTYSTLAISLFATETQRAASDQLPVHSADGTDVVAPGMSAAARAFLNGISGPESSGKYNIRYNGDSSGGATFDSYADHPRIYVQRSDGRWSSAAGRYQFTAQTWDDTVATMNKMGYNITDFSPVNQDRVAWFLAQQRYTQATGKDLEETLSTGSSADMAEVQSVLGNTWEGLKNSSFDLAGAISNGIPLGGTGHSQAPDIWNDPRFANMTYEDKYRASQAGTQMMLEAQKAQQAAEAAKQKALTDQVLSDIATNKPGAEQLGMKLVDTGYLTGENASKINTATAKARDDKKTVIEVSGMLLSQKQIGLDRAKDFDTFYEKSGVMEGLQKQDPVARDTFMKYSMEQGQIPPKMMGVLESGLSSTNPQARAYSMAILGDLYSQSPATFTNQSKEIQQQAALSFELTKYSQTPEQAAMLYSQMTGEQNSEAKRQKLQDFDKQLNDQGTYAFFQTALKQFDTSYFSDPQNPTAGGGTLAKFQTDYLTLFRENFTISGDMDTAHKMTAAMMKTVWAPDPLSGRLMEASPLAPGVVRPAPGQNSITINGSTDWIENSLRLQLGEPENDIAIMTDAQTLKDMKKKGYPTYNAFVYDQDGNITLAPMRVFVAQTPEVLRRERDLPATEAAAKEAERQTVLHSRYPVPNNVKRLSWSEMMDKIATATKEFYNGVERDFNPAIPGQVLAHPSQDSTATATAQQKVKDAAQEKRAAQDRANKEQDRQAAILKRERESVMAKIKRDNPSYDDAQIKRAYDIYQLVSKQGMTVQEAVKALDGE